MKRKEIKWVCKELVKAILIFFSCAIGMEGCFPILPAFFALCSRKGQASALVIVGAIAGVLSFMPLEVMLKYVFVMAVIGVTIKMYIWANRYCNNWIVAIIAGISVTVMNIAGNVFAMEGLLLFWAGLFEGCMVFGITMCLYWLGKIPYQWIYKLEEQSRKKPVVVMQEKEQQVQRMESFAYAVNGLSDAFFAMSQPKEKLPIDAVSTLEQEVTGKLCASCDGCALCWNENRMRRQGGIRALLYAVINHSSKEELLQETYVDNCTQYADMVEEAMQAFGRLEINYAWHNRLCENRYVIAQQLDAMADLVEEWAKARVKMDKQYKYTMAQISYEVGEKGLCIEDFHIFEENNRLCVEGYVSSKWNGGIPVKHYLQAVEKAVKRPMRLGKDSKTVLTQEPVLLSLYEDTLFYGLQGIATEKKFDSTITGDSFSFFSMDDGNYHICLSDGMGSGSRANQESEMVVDLLQKFIEAGFRKEIAIKLMNSAMVLQGEENNYSTLDYAMINLYTGQMELIKIGGAVSFIKRGNEVECIECQTLPGGADVRMEIVSQKKQLQNGDFLVMITDGVIEYLHVRNPKETLMDIISSIETENAGVLAERILQQVLPRCGGCALDDMTVLVTSIWEK
ncbi:MAG: SpoIIE family protein phosphatase [Agathobacter sp.]|nr:SpoIIE family protein phosphatase [Agathobacter sp.]